MNQRFEGHFEGKDKIKLFHQCWRSEKTRGTILITHGISEHSEGYDALAQDLAQSGWDVWAWDLPGHGRSEGKRGYIANFNLFIENLGLYLKLVEKERDQNQPLVLFGHSLGGLISTRFVEKMRPQGIRALCLSASAYGVAMKIPKVKEKIAHFAADWMPKLTLHNEIKYETLTRDSDRIRQYECDSLRHDKISPRLFLGMLENFELALSEASHLELPVLVQMAGKDVLVNSDKIREFFELVPSEKKKLFIYSDSYHEIFNDLDRQTVISDLKNFLGSLT